VRQTPQIELFEDHDPKILVPRRGVQEK
jgi:hypothetical protein